MTDHVRGGPVGQRDDGVVGVHLDEGDAPVGVGDGLQHGGSVLRHLCTPHRHCFKSYCYNIFMCFKKKKTNYVYLVSTQMLWPF